MHDFFIYNLIHERRLVFPNMLLFYGSMSLNSFTNSFMNNQTQVVVLRSHLNNTISEIKHKRLIRKVFITSICLVFCGILSLPLTSFYENMITRFLLPQNIESFLVCLLLLDQCKKILADSESMYNL